MRENVVFKGVNGEIQLLINEDAHFSTVLDQLRTKLTSAEEFFSHGTVVKLPPGINNGRREQIAAVFAEHGLACGTAVEKPEAVPTAAPERENYEIKALVISKTLRSGQKVVHDGSVVVIGDVNPGAQVTAGGDIIILGTCRGVAHAGAGGNQTATITANKLVATQLRIAGLIARSPDDLDKPAYVETARIRNGMVIIEPANR